MFGKGKVLMEYDSRNYFTLVVLGFHCPKKKKERKFLIRHSSSVADPDPGCGAF
jgi:hypothetical protein